MKHAWLIVVSLVGCAPQTHYVVSRMDGPFGPMESACEYNDRGYAACSVDANGVPFSFETAADAELPPAVPRDEQVAPDGLERLAPPTSETVARAFAAPAVRAKLAACRAEYGQDVDRVAAQVTVASSGTIAKVALAGSSDALGACIAHTLHAVKLAGFSGQPVTLAQSVSL